MHGQSQNPSFGEGLDGIGVVANPANTVALISERACSDSGRYLAPGN